MTNILDIKLNFYQANFSIIRGICCLSAFASSLTVVSLKDFVLFVNSPDLLTDTYQKYLLNQLRATFPFSGTPLLFDLKGKNPVKRK